MEETTKEEDKMSDAQPVKVADSKYNKEKDLLKWSGLKKPLKSKTKGDSKGAGNAEILRMMRYFSVLGVVSKEYGMPRASLIFLIGYYLKNKQASTLGEVHPSLAIYIKDNKLMSQKLLSDGFLRRVNPGMYEVSDKGLLVCVRLINAMRYSRDIDNYRYKQLPGRGYMKE